MPQMTRLQRDYCREALGLHKSRKCEQNWLHATFENSALTAAVDAGWMCRRKIEPVYLGYGKKLWEYKVTFEGAQKVLQPGEFVSPFVEFPGFPDAQIQLQL